MIVEVILGVSILSLLGRCSTYPYLLSFGSRKGSLDCRLPVVLSDSEVESISRNWQLA